MSLQASDFSGFFAAIHGHDPFPWQQDLVGQLSKTDRWPDVLDLPTGSGKTAVLDVAVFHLALRSDDLAKSALRIVLVVDRRLVVDDAHVRATKIAGALVPQAGLTGRLCDSGCKGCPIENPVVSEVARRFQILAGEGAPPLVVQRLRGGTPLEHDWARTPTQPVILCSTVDQVGSRLLFRGYGTSDRMKPVHAGLLGNHSLILLDEAHVSEPFRQTIENVKRIDTFHRQLRPNTNETQLALHGKVTDPDIKTVLLSATPCLNPVRPLRLSARDRAHAILKQRIEAPKLATLTAIRQDLAPEVFARAAREIVLRLLRQGISDAAVGVVVNRVNLAREVFRNLQAETDADLVLMIGRSRDVERDRIANALKPYRTAVPRRPQGPSSQSTSEMSQQLSDEADDQCRERPLIVVATQCLEVGVDLDLDGLVTQIASLDALRQRFGRLNRAGRPISAQGTILALSEDIAKNSDDPVYGDRLRKTWETLKQISRNDPIDFGISALSHSLEMSGIDAKVLATPLADAPTLMPAYVDLWSHTSPPPMASPDVGLFLHGIDRSAADVSLVWRGDVTEDHLKNESRANLELLLKLVPPRAAEQIDVPIWSARAWLERQPSGRSDRIADTPQRWDSDRAGEVMAPQHRRRGFRWAGYKDPRTGPVGPREIRPGDLIVVPAEYGGCDEFGWVPTSETLVQDVADIAAKPFRAHRHTVRLLRSLLPNHWSRISATLADDGVSDLELVNRLLEALPARSATEKSEGGADTTLAWSVREPLEVLLAAKGRTGQRISVHFPYPDGYEEGAVLVAPYGVQVDDGPREVGLPGNSATEDDSLSSTSHRAVSIQDHTDHVVCRTSRYVQTLGLPRPVSADLRLAAFLHDLGKADRRFQTYLFGGNPWNRHNGAAMAKSGGRLPDDAWECAGLPVGWRHEALSVAMAQVHPRFQGAHDPGLVLWLIGTHHGFGRPFFKFTDSGIVGEGSDSPVGCLDIEEWQLGTCPGPQSLAFSFGGADWATLFETLRDRYGTWRLAYWEAILRLADHRASEWEQSS